MNLETQTPDLLEKIKTDLRQNHQFASFSILPGLASEIGALKRLARKLDLTNQEIETYAERLFTSKLWILKDDRVCTNFEFLDLGDISVKDYLSTTISMISQLSDNKSYSYDTLSVVTNRGLIRGFITKVNQALRELHQKSQEAGIEKTTLFSWTHTGLVEIELKKKTTDDEVSQ